ncbi:ESPR-type extended signal peptide-containing protein [Veillonella sp.]|uniref:ESPR-type extended signal peptide-containing protein n=1 Tax=Veillonella sp. TaxID=1926307 RepID=UPI002580129A|nr:ESPR-type extended signal peptide-containing protein [Veillonella sp.]MBS6227729.1 YadA-like family protein [Veillonella sp.]
MNKIFKVVWSKTKECYVVVSEVAKNNGGKKKALSTVFAALVAAGAMMPGYVDAANNTSGGGVSTADASIAIGSGWGNSAYANNNFSIAIGDQTHANGKAAIALGRQAKTDGEEASIAIGNETEATAKDSTAVGSGSKSSGEYAAALGFQTKATANYATAIGSGARGYAEDSQAIGREAETSAGATRAIAIGTLSKSSGNYATSLGSSAEATAERAIAVGYKSKAEAERAISVGNLANATKNDSIAVGNNSAASGLNASAVGKNSKASGQSAAAFGDTAQATNTNATAVGNQANASNTNTTAIGNQTVASGGNATAVGHLSQATADGATAIGTNNKAGYEGTAVGLSNTVTGRTSAAFGRSNTVSGNESFAAGIRSTASGEHNVAIGYQAATDGKATVAIGEGSKADIADGVAIGSNSATTAAAGVQGFNPADSRTKTYGGLTGAAQTSTLGAVAVGNGATATRQITGLAAGKENTDAVNVAQLRSVNLKYAGNSGNSDVLLDNGTLNIKGEGLLSTTADGTGITVKLTKGDDIAKDNGKAKEPTNNGVATTQNVVQAINNSYWKATAGGNTDGTPAVGNVKPGTQVTYSAGDNLKVKQTINATTGDQEYKYSLNPVLTGITSIANTTTGPKMTFGGNSINITGGSLDMGTNKITNLAPGTADNDAVNVKQLKDTELHITPGTYTPDANKKVKLTYTDGNNTVVTGKEAVIDLSGLATGGTASTEKVKKAANGANDTNIAEVNPQTGDTYGAAGATYEVSVSRNAVKDAAREAVTVNNGGTTTGGTYTADTNNPISVTAVPDNTNHNTTYAVTFDGNKAAKQIPLTYKATNGTITTADQTVKLDKGLNFTGGDYTTASVGADGKVTFDVNLGTAPTVTDGKPGVPGQAGAAGKDGIATVKTVVDTINNSGWKANAKANGGTLVGNSTATVVKPGDQVNFAAGKNLTVKQDLTGEHTYTYSLNKDVDLTNAGSLTVGDTKVNNDGITIKAPTPAAGTTPTTDVKLTNTGLDNGGNKIVNVAEGTADTDAVNVKQLKDAKTVLADGKNTKKSGTGTAADPYKVNVEGDLTGISSITNGGTNNGKISFGPNKTVTVDGDHSITLNASTGKIGGLQNLTFDPTNFTSGQAATEDQLKSVHDTLKASELHIAPTESNRTGEHIAGAATSNTAAGAAANAYKYDATTKQVVLEYNDGTGANKTGTKAVIDFSALNTGGTTASTWTAKTSAENTTAGSEVGKHAGDTSQVIGNQNSVDFQAGKNMTVKQTNDGNGNTTINYALDKNLDVESVHVGKDGKDGKIGIDGKDGVDGLDGTNRVDIHVEKGAKGVDGTDGHDGVNGHNGKDGMTRIVYEDKGGKQEVATLNDGMKYAGDDAQGTDKTKVIAKKLNETLDIIGGATKADLTTDNIGVNNDGNGKLLVQLSKNLKGINTIKNGNTTITLNDTPSTTTPAVTITGGNLSLGDGTTNNKIVNVAPGTDDTDAVNVKQLKDAKTVLADGKNTKKSGTGTAADPYKVNVEGDLTEITSITNKADASGNAGKITFSPNQTVTVSGDHNISLNGKTGDITGLTNTTIPTTAGSDFATKGRAATEEQLKIVNDKFNNKINLGADGNTETTKLALDNNGGIKFNIKGDGSGASGANQYISTTANGSDIKVDLTDDAKAKLNKSYDVKSTDKSVTVSSTTTNGVTTFDLKVAPVAGTTSTWDIKSSADTANGGATATGHEVNAKTIANTNSVEMIAGKNLTVKQTSDTNGAKVEFALSDEIAVGKDGANGVDGKIGVNGKDGASVVINGKDGSIGLTGAPGTPGTPGASATLKVKDGVPGVDGAPGTNLTRIVYTDKNNVEHEVATHDDGMKFAGDDGQANQATNANVIKKHLNNVVDIIGGATKADLTTNNIGVNNDGNGKLLVQLSKNLNGINTVKNGNTTITLNDAPGGATNTPAVTISGGDLSVGGNKVTNVDDGTDNNDAVNVKQLKAAKTEVKAGKNVVVTSETSTTDGHTTYTVNASTPAVYTKPDGTKLVKQPDGTFKEENGTVYNGPVIASFEDGTGATTGGNMIVNNVGSAINNHATPGVTSPTYLDKLDAAAGDNNTKNAAVNVTDLKNTKDGLIDKGLKFDANVGGVKTNKLGSTVKVQGAGTSADADYSGTNIKTFISQTGDDTTIDVKLDKNLKGINKISNGGSSITLNDTPSATVPAVTITGGNLSMGDGTTNNKIVNLAPGTADTDAVNVKQLKDTELHITPGTYTPDTNKKVTLTYTNGNGTVVSGKEAVIDLSGLSTGGATASTWNVKSSANTTDGGAVGATHDATAQNIANGKTVEFQSGKNLVVNQTNDTTNGNATVEFSLSDNITVGKDGANGKDGSVGAKGADGSAVVMNGKDGSIGLNGTNGANGISIKGKDGANGVGIDGKDGVTRIVYTEKVPDPAHPGTTKEVTHEVATMDDGLKFTGNNTGTVNKHKLGSLVKVQGEGVSAADEAAFQSASGNIAVTADGTDTLTIRLNKNLKGLNSIQLGDNTIKSNGDNIEFTTKGGTTKTVATTDQLWTIQANGTDVPATNGKVNVVGKDGITVAKNAAGNLEISGTGLGTMNGFDVTANNGATSKTITDGKKVDFNAGSNLTVKQTSDANGTHIEYALKEAVDLGTNGSLKAGDTTVNKDGVTIANGPSITKTGVDAGDKKITNVADGAVNATSKDAVNGSQLKKYTDAAKTTVEAGDNNVKVETDNSAADGHTNYKVSLEPVVTIGDTHKVKIDGHTGDITGLTNVTLTDPTFATKGRAATEEQLNKVLTEAKKKAVEKVQAGTAAAGDTNIATVAPKAGDTFGAAGATYEVSVSKNAVKDAAKEAVKVTSASPAITVTADTSVAHETTYKVGFDGNQAATQIPLTYKQNGGSARTVKLSDGLNFIDGTNTKARTAADGKVTFDVMGDLTGITSISNAAGGPKMTFGGNSINVTGGNLDMGGKKITNIGKGTDPTDAARVGQLTKVTSNNHSVVINKTTDADGAPVYDLAVTGTPGAPAADPRVDMLGEEIGRVGAQGAALSALKPIQYDPLEPTQIMAGYGNYRGNSAVALGVAHYKNESTLIHGGVSWAGGSSHMMANAGVTWKVGNRDSEAAVADRYRKGPISSAYAMQQEMAAMKAQNAGLKGEVSDLKAENEQMKAQIAAMMAKLGL